jgi:hypothetical protein
METIIAQLTQHVHKLYREEPDPLFMLSTRHKALAKRITEEQKRNRNDDIQVVPLYSSRQRFQENTPMARNNNQRFAFSPSNFD